MLALPAGLPDLVICIHRYSVYQKISTWIVGFYTVQSFLNLARFIENISIICISRRSGGSTSRAGAQAICARVE
jgi:hypothetical protein